MRLCECGCGEATLPASITSRARGWVKGEPLRFINGHHVRDPRSPAERLWKRVDKTSGCWIWTGGQHGAGYGALTINGQHWLAHRLAYELEVGPIPEGLTLDHLCRNRLCVNPAHLEPVTLGENVRRGCQAITHCPRGHPYDEANTYVTPTGGRQCRACKRLRDASRPTTAPGRQAIVGVSGAWIGHALNRSNDAIRQAIG